MMQGKFLYLHILHVQFLFSSLLLEKGKSNACSVVIWTWRELQFCSKFSVVESKFDT